MNILLTAIGKRVQLISFLKKSFNIIGVDCSSNNPAKHFVDAFFEVPSYQDEKYVDTLLKICNDKKINVLIPLFEREYLRLDSRRKEFHDIGVHLLLSNYLVLNICEDKFKTYEFFLEQNIQTPKTWSKSEDVNICDDKSFFIIKPRDGMGSQGVYRAKNKEELNFFSKYVPNSMIQEFIQGTEYTIDVFCDNGGRVVSCVPRERLQVRAGEVSKSITRNHPRIIEEVVEICEKLGGVGPLTLQCIEDSKGEIYWIEINPRFGGGVPLSIEAGIDYGKMIKEWAEGKLVESQMGKFKPNLLMLRYDDAIFLENYK